MSEEYKQAAVTVSTTSGPSASERAQDCALHAEELARFQQLLKEDPEYAYRRCGVGLLYSLPGDEMLDELKKFGWKARDAQDLYNLGAIHSKKGETKEALKYYEKAVEIDPEHCNSQFNLALTYRELNETQKARAAMEKCIKILEGKSELYNWEKDDLEQAKQFLKGLK